MACITVSRGSPTALTSLAWVIGPSSARTRHTMPATSPIDATRETVAAVAIISPRLQDNAAHTRQERNASEL